MKVSTSGNIENQAKGQHEERDEREIAIGGDQFLKMMIAKIDHQLTGKRSTTNPTARPARKSPTPTSVKGIA